MRNRHRRSSASAGRYCNVWMECERVKKRSDVVDRWWGEGEMLALDGLDGRVT